MKMGLNASAKSIDPCQPAQYALADIGRNFSPSLDVMNTIILSVV